MFRDVVDRRGICNADGGGAPIERKREHGPRREPAAASCLIQEGGAARDQALRHGRKGVCQTAAKELGRGVEGEGNEKTRRPAASSGTIPTCKNPVTRPGIESGRGLEARLHHAWAAFKRAHLVVHSKKRLANRNVGVMKRTTSVKLVVNGIGSNWFQTLHINNWCIGVHRRWVQGGCKVAAPPLHHYRTHHKLFCWQRLKPSIIVGLKELRRHPYSGVESRGNVNHNGCEGTRTEVLLDAGPALNLSTATSPYSQSVSKEGLQVACQSGARASSSFGSLRWHDAQRAGQNYHDKWSPLYGNFFPGDSVCCRRPSRLSPVFVPTAASLSPNLNKSVTWPGGLGGEEEEALRVLDLALACVASSPGEEHSWCVTPEITFTCVSLLSRVQLRGLGVRFFFQNCFPNVVYFIAAKRSYKVDTAACINKSVAQEASSYKIALGSALPPRVIDIIAIQQSREALDVKGYAVTWIKYAIATKHCRASFGANCLGKKDWGSNGKESVMIFVVDPSQHSLVVISGNYGKPKSGWPDRELNPGPPERESEYVERSKKLGTLCVLYVTGDCSSSVELKSISPPPPRRQGWEVGRKASCEGACETGGRAHACKTPCGNPLSSPAVQDCLVRAARAVVPSAKYTRRNHYLRRSQHIPPAGPLRTTGCAETRFILPVCVGVTVAEWLACSPPTKANQVQPPGWVTPGFSQVGIGAGPMPLVGGISRGYPVPHSFVFRRCYSLTLFHLCRFSVYLVVKACSTIVRCVALRWAATSYTCCYQLGSILVDDRPIMNAVKYRVVSCRVWANRTMASSNTDTNRAGVFAVVDIGDSLLICLRCKLILTPTINRNSRISRNALDADALRRNLLRPDWLPLIATQRNATHYCGTSLRARLDLPRRQAAACRQCEGAWAPACRGR
ncbi:hypothetical protein PR048_029223 [Dryococelus australis]|uniref:Uncharacterized protein n=1 Tax=Dryococelus australis TaxID=614101 RepID=A0ABQ9GFH3_9NEOP|nr:hypothetical protein PR048_029223 [Dryococelus australis]